MMYNWNHWKEKFKFWDSLIMGIMYLIEISHVSETNYCVVQNY